MRYRPYLLASVVFLTVVATAFVLVVVKASTGRSSSPLSTRGTPPPVPTGTASPPSAASADQTGPLRPVLAAPSCAVASVAYIDEALGISANTCQSYPIGGGTVICQYSSNDPNPMNALQATVTYLPDMTHEKFVEIRTHVEQPLSLPAGVTPPPGMPTSTETVVTDYPGLGDEAYFTTTSYGGVPLVGPPTLAARQSSLEIQVESAVPLDVEAALIRDLFAVLT